jgi:hypothetical protein
MAVAETIPAIGAKWQVLSTSFGVNVYSPGKGECTMRTQTSLVAATVLAAGAWLGSLTASGGLVTIAQAQSQPNTFADRLMYSRAIEAALWARPLTGSQALMNGLQRDAGVGYNDIGYWVRTGSTVAGVRSTSLLALGSMASAP